MSSKGEPMEINRNHVFAALLGGLVVSVLGKSRSPGTSELDKAKEVLTVLVDRYWALWHLPIDGGPLYSKYGSIMTDRYGYWNQAEVYDVLGMPYPWTPEGKEFHNSRTRKYVLG